MKTATKIKHAATIVLQKQIAGKTHVLMGRRHPESAFLPNKYVFPGGAVETQDHHTPAHHPLNRACHAALMYESDIAPHALAIAALRELYEETGLRLEERYDLRSLRFFFRALTPKGLARRYDTRFFVMPATALIDEKAAFAPQDNELLDLGWYTVEDALQKDVIFITQFVLELLQKPLSDTHIPWQVASFDLRDQQQIPREAIS